MIRPAFEELYGASPSQAWTPQTEAMLTMEPCPDLSSSGTAYFVIRKGPVRLVRRMASQVSSSNSCTGRKVVMSMPALLTRISSRPRAETASSTRRRASAGLPTSPSSATARPPEAFTPATTSSRASRLRMATAATVAPSSAKRSTMARPRPRDAPVTSAARPARRPVRVAPPCCSTIVPPVAPELCTVAGGRWLRTAPDGPCWASKAMVAAGHPGCQFGRPQASLRCIIVGRLRRLCRSTASPSPDDATRPSRHDHRFQPQQAAHFLNGRGLVSYPERHVVRRPFGAPAVDELVRRQRETQAAVGVADAQDRARQRLALRRQQLEAPVRGLRQAQDGHRPGLDVEFDGKAGAGLAMIEAQAAQDGAPVADGQMPGAVVAHQQETLVQVHGIEFGKRSADAQPVQ